MTKIKPEDVKTEKHHWVTEGDENRYKHIIADKMNRIEEEFNSYFKFLSIRRLTTQKKKNISEALIEIIKKEFLKK